MYEEGNRKLSLNWGSLAIKLGILAVVVFVVCLIVTRFTGNNNNSSSSDSLAMGNTEYITNITAMKDAAFEYFTPSKLPEKVGGTEKLTLSQMLNQKLLIDFTEDGDVCDINSSYVQTTKTADGNYALKVSLDCGDKSDFIVTTIEEDTCTTGNCDNSNTNSDVVIDDTPIDTPDDNSDNGNSDDNIDNSNNNNSGSSSTGGSSSSSKVTTTVKTTVRIKITCSTGCCFNNCNKNNNNNNNNDNNNDNDNNNGDNNNGDNGDNGNNGDKPTDETTRYYKFVKWSDWRDGKSNDPDAENKKITTTTYNYCLPTEKTYYSTSYVSNSTNTNSGYNYEIQFLDIDPNDIEGTVKIVNSSESYFSSGLTDYRTYINNKNDIYMTGNTGRYDVLPSNPTSFRNSSLDSSNFTFNVGNIYLSGGIYRTTVTINYKNHNGVTPYNSNLGYQVYFVPLKFDVEFIDKNDCIRDTEENEYLYDGYKMRDPKEETAYMHRIPIKYKWSTEKYLEGYEYTGIYEDRIS